MKQKMNSLRNFVLSLSVMGALVFGTTQAMAYTTCLTCDPEPDVECALEPFPNLFCEYMCVQEWGCFSGECHGGEENSECRCYEE